MANKVQKELLENLKETSFFDSYSPDQIEELSKLYENADADLLRTAIAEIESHEEKYQQKIEKLSEKEANRSAKKLNQAMQEIQTSRQKRAKQVEKKERKSEESMLKAMEKQITNL